MPVSFNGFLNTKSYCFVLHDKNKIPVLKTWEINTNLYGNDYDKFIRSNIRTGRDFLDNEDMSLLKMKVNQYLDIEHPEWLDFFVNEKNLKITGQNYPIWEFLEKFLWKMSKAKDDDFLVDIGYLTSKDYIKYWDTHPYLPKDAMDFIAAEAKIFDPDEIKYGAEYFKNIVSEAMSHFIVK